MKTLLALITLTGILLAQSPTKHSVAEIKGTVIDESGSAVASATVYLVPQGLTLDNVTPRSVKTDGKGTFDFRGGLELREYKLYARKDVDGYPNPVDSFYSDDATGPTEVTLTRRRPFLTVTVKLGQQAAVVSGKIFDSSSGSLVKASLGFLDGEGNGHSIVTDRNYRFVVPSDKDLTLMVTVLEPAGRPLIPRAPLRLQPGLHVYLDIPVSTSDK